MSNKMFPAGIDPLSDLIDIKIQLASLTEAVIQLQMNQNELIKANQHYQQLQQGQQQRNQQTVAYIKKLNEEIKELRNRPVA